MLVLLDKPFVSDFLVDTLKYNNYQLVSTAEARELVPDITLNWITENEAARLIRRNPESLLYTNSENALSWIAAHAPGSPLSGYIRQFKDKTLFRKLVESFQKGLFFQSLDADQLQNLKLEDVPLPFVIKPSVGFFSLGVYIIHNQADWLRAKKALKKENLAGIFPPSVLDSTTFLMEEFIQGEEFAIDCYFDQKGNAVILNILHHRFASGEDTSDRVYSTSRDIVLKHLRPFEDFLNTMGRAAGVRNFPAHVELRIDKEGKINPIEVNPLRFGGFCTTADLPGIALDYNIYEYYAKQKKPDWQSIFRHKEDRLYSIVVLNNNSGIKAENIKYFDYHLLSSDFETPLELRSLDIKKYPVFGFLFAETTPGKEEELNQILNSDLKKYITIETSP